MMADPRASFATKLIGLFLDKYPDGSFYIKKTSIYLSGNITEKDGKKYATTAVTCWYNQQEVQFTLYEALNGHYLGLKPSAFYNYTDVNSLKQKEIDDKKWMDEAIKQRGFDPVFSGMQVYTYIRTRDELAPERYNKTSDYYNRVEALTIVATQLPLLRIFFTSGKKPSGSNASSEPVSLYSKPIGILSSEETLILGKYLKNIGDYKVYEGGEVFYRGMSNADYQFLIANKRLQVTSNTSEMFTSPSLEYIKSVGYGGDGVIIKFQMRSGTLEKLASNGIRDQSSRADELYPNMPSPAKPSGWMERGEVYFKQETIKGTNTKQVNIGLGRNTEGGLKIFNDNILKFEVVQ